MTDVGRWARRWAALLVLLCACAPPALEQPDGEACVPAERLFADRLWPEVLVRCAGCHTPGGAAGATRLLLQPPGAEGALAHNFAALDRARALREGDTPLLLLKPTAAVPHGGGEQIRPGGPEEALLREVLAAYDRPACGAGTVPPPRDVREGVELLGAPETLRKAALQLAGRLPTEEELAAARAGGLDALDPLLLRLMDERAFGERIKEIFNDVLLTDAALFWRAYDSVVSKALDARTFPRWYGSPDTDAGRLTIDAVAREPLEMIARIVQLDRPATEIITARYRLVNPYTARLYGLRPAFRDPADLSEHVEVQVPPLHEYAPGQGEYAGVLTTTSFLYRYPNTETNRNRQRARYFLQHFLGYDIMRLAPRLDLSTVDFTADPWRRNPLCTGCHATLDPIAGAFQNWTNCYSGQGIRYYRPGERHCQGAWYPDATMFPPGTGAGAERALTPAQLPRALEVLAASAAASPGFARAMVMHLLRGLIGRPLLLPPTDPQEPGYASLALAYEDQQRTIEQLATDFVKGGHRLKRLIVAIVKSAAFRAATADRAGRLELSGLGGGVLTPPEVLHRKILSVVGRPWGTAGSLNDRSTRSSPFYLLGYDKLRVIYGGIDSGEVTARQTLPGGLGAAASQRMAYEMACSYVAQDFAAPRAARRLFPHVDRDRVPSGDAQADADVLRNLQHLHHRVLGEELDPTSPELRESYALLLRAQRQGAAALAEGRAPRQLGARCRASIDYATGQPVAGGFSDDPAYVVRAWQAVVAYLLMDYKFLFE